jgi:3-deoxy-D-manno-octulosonate 8-phosphate phosphatase (KDO 8-P phosphatase)
MTNHFISNLEYFGKEAFLLNSICHQISYDRKLTLLNGTALPDAGELLLISAYYNISVDRLLKKDLTAVRKDAGKIKLVVFDVDGVLTDGGMYYTESGDEFKKFNSKDGLAIRRLAKQGIVTGIISHGINRKLIERRAALLGITNVYTGDLSKAEVLNGWCTELAISPEEIAYIGDDVNDLPAIRLAGFSACPADAVAEVKDEVDIILNRKGGEACVREWIDGFLL